MIHISVFVPEQAVMEAISPPYRLFTSANLFLQQTGRNPLFEVNLVGNQKEILVQDGEYIVKVHKTLDAIQKTDLILIPALYGDIKQALQKNKEVLKWIKNMHWKGAEVASLCIGAFLLAETGLLEQKECSTHWAYQDLFKAMYPDIILRDGNIISEQQGIYSSGGANSIWNLLLYILEKYTDREIAIMAAKFFAIDYDRFHQGYFTIFNAQKKHQDQTVLEVQEFLENNFKHNLTVSEIAMKHSMNRRSIERRFKSATNNTIVEYLQRVRVEKAKRLLEASNKNVSEIMYEVGYSDQKAFRQVFKKITSISPQAYKNKYLRPVL